MHRPTAGRTQKFSCPICQQPFFTARNKEKHVLLVHKNAGQFKCDQCVKTFRFEFNLTAHKRTHMPAKPFHCTICQKQFTQNGHLTAHHLDVHAEKKFKCSHCDKAFGREISFNRHLLVHSGEKPFRCEICQMEFTQIEDLRRHRLSQHPLCFTNLRIPIDTQARKCGTCGLDFKSELNLKRHLILHSPNKPFKCNLCEDSFHMQSSLNEHQASHSTTKLATIRTRSFVQIGVQIGQTGGGIGAAAYPLRAVRKIPYYGVKPDESSSSGESGSESQDDAEDELSEMVGVLEENQIGHRDCVQLDGPATNNKNVSSGNPEVITLSSDGNDQDGEPSSTTNNTNLKLVFDVQYRASD